MAYAALFLVSNESSCVNALTLFLDGGYLGNVRGSNAISEWLAALSRAAAMHT
jgi:hypothetical protein